MEFLIYTICYHGAPTLTGKKASNLIAFSHNHKDLAKVFDQYEEVVRSLLPLPLVVLQRNKRGTVILIYQPLLLENKLKDPDVQEFLQDYGYDTFSIIPVLTRLSDHFNQGCPHEMGVILDYPLSDVKAFISGEGQPCPLVGYWKAYTNKQQALNTFRQFDLAKRALLHKLRSGHSPSELVSLLATA